jgi:hypothetical protein
MVPSWSARPQRPVPQCVLFQSPESWICYFFAATFPFHSRRPSSDGSPISGSNTPPPRGVIRPCSHPFSVLLCRAHQAVMMGYEFPFPEDPKVSSQSFFQHRTIVMNSIIKERCCTSARHCTPPSPWWNLSTLGGGIDRTAALGHDREDSPERCNPQRWSFKQGTISRRFFFFFFFVHWTETRGRIPPIMDRKNWCEFDINQQNFFFTTTTKKKKRKEKDRFRKNESENQLALLSKKKKKSSVVDSMVHQPNFLCLSRSVTMSNRSIQKRAFYVHSDHDRSETNRSKKQAI